MGIRHRERLTRNCKIISLKILQDGSRINAAGIKWFPKEDLLAFDIAELSFARKHHGKKPAQHQNIIQFKRQEEIVFQKHLVKRVKRGLSWDNVISDDLRSVWVSHSKMMQEIGNKMMSHNICHIFKKEWYILQPAGVSQIKSCS